MLLLPELPDGVGIQGRLRGSAHLTPFIQAVSLEPQYDQSPLQPPPGRLLPYLPG